MCLSLLNRVIKQNESLRFIIKKTLKNTDEEFFFAIYSAYRVFSLEAMT